MHSDQQKLYQLIRACIRSCDGRKKSLATVFMQMFLPSAILKSRLKYGFLHNLQGAFGKFYKAATRPDQST